METDKILICRLCFEICKSGFEVIQDSTKETLNFLLLNLDLGISDEPVVCDGCVDSLKECLDSKTDSLRKSGSIVIKREGVDLNFPEIHLGESGIDTPETFNNSDICCSCMELTNHESSVHLINEENNVVTMLEKYFPELNLNGTTDSMCVACYISLQNQMAFISKCLDVEEKIKEYCKTEGTNCKGQVELGNVLHFVSKNQLRNNIYSGFSAVTVEKTCEETEKKDKSEIKNEHLVKVEEPGVCSAEKENIDIKMEQNEGDRFNAFQTTQKSCADLPSQTDTAEVIQFRCDMCSYQTKRKSNFSRHLLNHKHPSEVTMYKCKICRYQNRLRYKLSNHMLSHRDPSEVTMYKCDICTYQCIQKYGLSQHMLTHKDASEMVMHKCKICTYQSKRKYNLSLHILRRHGPSDGAMYMCEICAYQCRLKYRLAEHMLTHKDPSEVVMYKCELCTYQSKRKCNLSRHILSHSQPSEVTMYKCKMCTYQSRHRYKLSKHIATHKDPK